ncbi:MAG: TIGR02587 family membrane protein [Actinomycetota bacterium]|nr:TIGR02587 family membrane protein [Actinomycetota bacterium]
METDTASRAEGPEAGPWHEELAGFVRAASGGLLFGVPLLYTMEVWWTGRHTDPEQMLLVLGLLCLPVLALNKTTGFRQTRDVRLRDAVVDTVEALAVGVVVTTIVLILLREITFDTSLRPGLGTVVYEAVPFCLGVGVARHFLHGGRTDPDDDAEEHGPDRLHPTLADLGATVVGAVFVSLNIAPTDEVPMLAAAMQPQWLLAMVAMSLVSSYAIVFAAGFTSQDTRHEQEGPFQRPVTETVVSYLVSLVVAGLLLWLFQRGVSPADDFLARVVVLGFPAAIGGAAGRLAV